MKRSTKNPSKIFPAIDKNQVIVMSTRKVLKSELTGAMKDQLKSQPTPHTLMPKNNFLEYHPRKNAKSIPNKKYYIFALIVRWSVFVQNVSFMVS